MSEQNKPHPISVTVAITVAIISCIGAILAATIPALINSSQDSITSPISTKPILPEVTNLTDPIFTPTYPPAPDPIIPVTEPVKYPVCSFRQSRGQVLVVTQSGTQVTAKNIAEFPVTIRISWDNQDPGGIGGGDSIISKEWITQNNSFSGDITSHASAQIWAWDSTSKCVDSFWLDIE